MRAIISRRLMEYLQANARGEENAVPRDEVLAELRLFDAKLGDRAMRDAYSRLPVCACERGLFIPIRPGEVDAFRAYLERKVGPIIAARRVATIYAFYPKLRRIDETQMSLLEACHE